MNSVTVSYTVSVFLPYSGIFSLEQIFVLSAESLLTKFSTHIFVSTQRSVWTLVKYTVS